MWNKAKNVACNKNYRCWACYAMAFGIGVTVSCFCPQGLLLFIAAVIITALGIQVIRH